MSKFKPLFMIATLTSSLFIAACTKPQTIICINPIPVDRWFETVIADEEKIVLSYASYNNEEFVVGYGEYKSIYLDKAYYFSSMHCSTYGKTSKLENESTNEGLTSLSFSCIKK
ncbi:MAG: hypothetical protein CBC12_06735 [Candidatus Puniceispirillum sp. TMED52]|nr:hypothetical protein [SAR116 cluster bacterium]OUU49892.1 MAG: hypothetical protein CBC12_06735 [Candidatus Puniceispirillum sp. TMED52]|tara:strand:- start:1451 stop:1792 length:342 start_codon:yes stop_codon:yes gene_type:complete